MSSPWLSIHVVRELLGLIIDTRGGNYEGFCRLLEGSDQAAEHNAFSRQARIPPQKGWGASGPLSSSMTLEVFDVSVDIFVVVAAFVVAETVEVFGVFEAIERVEVDHALQVVEAKTIELADAIEVNEVFEIYEVFEVFKGFEKLEMSRH